MHEGWTISHQIDVAQIAAALHRLGGEPIAVPAALDGSTVGVRFNKSVIASFGSCPELVGPWHSCAFLWQSPKPYILAPAGVSPAAFTEFSPIDTQGQLYGPESFPPLTTTVTFKRETYRNGPSRRKSAREMLEKICVVK